MLLKLLKKSKRSYELRYLLPDILLLVKGESITDDVIDFCINYPTKGFRNTLIIQLAHIWLNPNQLELLNSYLPTAEAFCKLLIIYSSDRNYMADTLSSLLENNRSYMDDAKYCIDHFLDRNSIDEEKIAVLKNYELL